MLIKINILLAFVFVHTAHAQQQLRFDNPPVNSPAIFAPALISTGFSERDFALSPDEKEIFYTLQSAQGVFQTILHSTLNSKGKWSKPEVASFAGTFSDLEPAFSSDGKKLFFSSNRPITGTEIKDFDIWMVEKKNGVWGKPENIGASVNTGADEFYPSITKSGNLYFTATYKNGVGKEDIWVSKWINGKYTEATPLDTSVNSKTYEFNAFVSPEEDYIIFTSYGRKDDKGRGDLYMSTRDAGGKWLPAQNLSLLNSEKLDYCPFLSFDKKKLFFTSERHDIPATYSGTRASIRGLLKSFSSPLNGNADIYWISFPKVLEGIK